MPTTSNDLFFSRLPVNALPLGDLLMEDHLFFTIPDNWHVLITDVRNSTQAAIDGKHQTVNLVATGSIVAALNIAFKNNILIPFFFGGDGATFIIPGSLLDATLKALQQHKENTFKSFNLDLRVGHVPVADIYKEQHQLKISKLKTSNIFTIPVLLGSGLMYAEKKIKGVDYSFPKINAGDEELDMSGMQCRWDKIQPPLNEFEVVSLLVLAKDDSQQALVFKTVIENIDKIYGAPEKRKPISVNRLRLKTSIKRISSEMRTRLGKYKPWYLIQTWVITNLGKLYFRTKKGKEYLNQLVEMSDNLVIDGKINTVITGTAAQREELNQVLQAMEEQDTLMYGLHVSKASVMSCYVRNFEDQHIHFIDGDDGGYTKAAIVLKKKLAPIK